MMEIVKKARSSVVINIKGLVNRIKSFFTLLRCFLIDIYLFFRYINIVDNIFTDDMSIWLDFSKVICS